MEIRYSFRITKQSVKKKITTYKSKKAIISANKPVVSAKANPNIAYENNCPLKEGFLATPKIKAPKTTPIPTPAPIRPVVAKSVLIISHMHDHI